MSRRRGYENRRGKTTLPFVQVHHWIMDCPAWRALGSNARDAYWALKRHYTGSNNGLIGFSVRQCAEACTYSPATASRALQRLVDYGFIVATSKGTVGTGSSYRMAATWLLTEHQDNRNDQKATKDFLQWHPDVSPALRKNRSSVSKSENDVARVQRGGNRIPQTEASRFTGATSDADLADSTFHGCNTLTSSHRHEAPQHGEPRPPSRLGRDKLAGQAGGEPPAVTESLLQTLKRPARGVA